MLPPLQFDPELVARYDGPGPRYTSYPTTPQFRPDFGEAGFVAQAADSNDDLIPRRLSLYVHVPFCQSPCFYCGCTRIITRDRNKADGYLARLQREIALTSVLFDSDRPVVQLHLGGGTPNFLDAGQMTLLAETLAARFPLASGKEREFGVEIDPRYADADYIAMLAALGFNRLSVGVQDFDPAVQAAVNRRQTVEQTAAVIEAARRCGLRSVNVDLIYGLPLQTPEAFARTLDQVIALRPDRVAAYSYAHLPRMFRPQRQVSASDLPSPQVKLALLGLTIQHLTGAGYHYIGMDHFALPNDDLVKAQRHGTLTRNFQGYSTHGDCDLIGLGMSAISSVGDSYSQNQKNLIAYYAALDAGRLPIARGLRLTDDDRVRRDLIMQLMCHGVLDIPSFEERHRLDFARYFAGDLARLSPLARDGLVEVSPFRIGVTPRGRLLLRPIAMCFDAYLAHEPPAVADLPRYSRTI